MAVAFEYSNHFNDYSHVTSRLVLGVEDIDFSPLVSVIMPIYNHPDFFRKSLSSVVNQICDFEYEIIIVDNGHPEFQPKNQGIVEKLMNANMRYYVNNENIGGCANENRGIELAKGKYITFCHDDDILYEDALQKLIDFKKRTGNDGSAVFGSMIKIDENDCERPSWRQFDNPLLKSTNGYKVSLYDLLFRNYTNGCGSLYLKENLLNIGGFNCDYIPCPDYALNTYYTMMFGSWAIKDKTLKYRVSLQSDTSLVYKKIIEANRKIKEAIFSSKYICRAFPHFLIISNLSVVRYHLYSEWDNRPGSCLFYISRVINKIWLLFLIIGKRYRAIY